MRAITPHRATPCCGTVSGPMFLTQVPIRNGLGSYVEGFVQCTNDSTGVAGPSIYEFSAPCRTEPNPPHLNNARLVLRTLVGRPCYPARPKVSPRRGRYRETFGRRRGRIASFFRR